MCYLDGILSLSVASMPEAMPKGCRPIQAMQLVITPTVLTRLQASYEMRSIMLQSQLASFRLRLRLSMTDMLLQSAGIVIPYTVGCMYLCCRFSIIGYP